MTRTRQILLFLGACGLFACGGDDDGIVIADSGPTVDSGPDANLGCGDYEEAAEATNNSPNGGTAEATGISFAAGDTKVVCGVIDPTQADDATGTVDLDGFDFDVGENAPLRIVLRSPNGADLGGLGVFLEFVDPEQGTFLVARGTYLDGYALATSRDFGPGSWRLEVFAFPGETPPAAPIEYEIEIGNWIAPCDAATGAADYTEAKDGAKSRRNDVVSAAWAPGLTATLTGATTDAPEPTALTVGADPLHIVGTSARVTANDDYHDKDTYLVTNGDTANEWDVRLTWPDGDIDMDLLAFIAETTMPRNLADGSTFVNTMDDESFTIHLPAGLPLWIWAGAYNEGATDLPVDYDITICPRTFTP
jgi:hypothetical protein